MTPVTYKEAIRSALADALEQDDRVLLLGEDIAAAGGVFKVTEGLLERFGPDRVYDTPISEQAIIGSAIGAALKGHRPVAEVMFADFAGVCFDQIANQLAKYRYMTGGQVTLPVTIRLANGASAGFGAQHSQSVENWFLNCPGLKIVAPGSPADAYSLLLATVRDDDPVLFFEHKALYNQRGDLEDGTPPAEIGRAAILRSGGDVTVVATQLMRQRAAEAAGLLADEGVEVELIDPRTLVPLDFETIGESVDRTGRLVVVQESSFGGSWGATLVAGIVRDRFESLDAAPLVLGGPDTPIPYAGELENAWLPDTERIAAEIRDLMEI